MDAQMERILDRVQKMLALANDAAATEGERDNALRMAHATLAKYNLSLASVESRAGKKGAAEAGGERMKHSKESTVGYAWARTAAMGVGKLFFCTYFFIPLRTGSRVIHCFVGREANAITAELIADYINRSILREANRRRREGGHDGSWLVSFCKGAAVAVYRRCEELARRNDAMNDAEPTQPSAPGTAVALANHYASEEAANLAFISSNVGELKAKKSTQRNTRYDGFASGADYGRNINLDRQVG